MDIFLDGGYRKIQHMGAEKRLFLFFKKLFACVDQPPDPGEPFLRGVVGMDDFTGNS